VSYPVLETSKVVTDRGIGFGADASALAIQPDGRIVVAGWIAPSIRT